MSTEELYTAISLGLFGLALGSFLNVVVDRLPRGKSIVTRASHCEVCDTRLGILDLVPFLSFLALRGRCRHCGARIPAKLPAVELFTGLVFAYIGYEYGFEWEALILLVYSSILIVVFMVDLERQLILNSVILPAILLAVALSPVRPDNVSNEALEVFWKSMAGGGIGLGVILLIYLFARGGMGEGDIKLGAFIGLITGFPAVFTALLLSFISGGLIGTFLLITRIRTRKQAIPFGPFLAVSALLHLFWGRDIYDWYIDIF